MPDVAAVSKTPIRDSYEVDSEHTHPNGPAFMHYVVLDEDNLGATCVPGGVPEVRTELVRRVLRSMLVLDVMMDLEAQDRADVAKLADVQAKG